MTCCCSGVLPLYSDISPPVFSQCEKTSILRSQKKLWAVKKSRQRMIYKQLLTIKCVNSKQKVLEFIVLKCRNLGKQKKSPLVFEEPFFKSVNWGSRKKTFSQTVLRVSHSMPGLVMLSNLVVNVGMLGINTKPCVVFSSSSVSSDFLFSLIASLTSFLVYPFS